MVVVLHDPGKGYQEPTTFMSGSSQVTWGVNEIAIRIIVFDELELISVVSRGLTLSTASLVMTRII